MRAGQPQNTLHEMRSGLGSLLELASTHVQGGCPVAIPTSTLTCTMKSAGGCNAWNVHSALLMQAGDRRGGLTFGRMEPAAKLPKRLRASGVMGEGRGSFLEGQHLGSYTAGASVSSSRKSVRSWAPSRAAAASYQCSSRPQNDTQLIGIELP